MLRKVIKMMLIYVHDISYQKIDVNNCPDFN